MNDTTSFTGVQFRAALGAYATGVAVVAAPGEDGAAIGITINSFASLSLDPPLVLWCIDRASERFGHFERSGHFTINILSADQEDVARRFVMEHRFGSGDPRISQAADDSLVLEGALASFACTCVDRLDGGDHVILVGRVDTLQMAPAGAGLTYFRGKFGRAPDPVAT